MFNFVRNIFDPILYPVVVVPRLAADTFTDALVRYGKPLAFQCIFTDKDEIAYVFRLRRSSYSKLVDGLKLMNLCFIVIDKEGVIDALVTLD